VVVATDPTSRPSLEEIRRQVFPGGDPLTDGPGSVDETSSARPPLGEVDQGTFDPNRAAREPEVAPPPQPTETVPSGPDEQLDELWASGVPGLLTFPPAPERDRLPRDRVPDTTAGTAGRTSDAAESSGSGAAVSGSGSSVAQPRSTRTGSDGQMQALVSSQVVVGDGRPGTTPGRVDFFRAGDGTIEAVQTSARRRNVDSTETLWVSDLGESVGSNPAGRVTSVQRVGSPGFPVGASTRAVRIRTGEHTQPLAGAGPGSVPGSVSYRPVPGNLHVQDIVVRPSATRAVNRDGSTTVTYSAVVPTNRELNSAGAPERFRVAVGTPMHPVRRSVLIPAPAPTHQPEYVPSPEPGPDRGTEAEYSPQPSPALLPAPQSQPRSEPPVPARQPAPAPNPEWWEQAGQAAIDVLTYPHPLDPVRGALGGVWQFLPGAAGAGDPGHAY